MTDQIFDDRASAYVGAREALKAATAIKVQARRDELTDSGGMAPAELGDEYWSLIAEAAVLSNLARADAAVGYLAGNYTVDQAKRIERNKRQRIREDVHARIQASREAAEAVTTHDHAVGPPPFAQGHTVKLTAGEYAGRLGRVYETRLTEGEPVAVLVELAPPGRPDDPSEPITLTVTPDDLELAEY